MTTQRVAGTTAAATGTSAVHVDSLIYPHNEYAVPVTETSRTLRPDAGTTNAGMVWSLDMVHCLQA